MNKCELCGTPVKVVGDTTKHYEPVEDEGKKVQAKLDIAVKALEKIADTDNGHLAPGFGADSRAIGMLEGLIMAGKEAKKALVQITERSTEK